MDSARNSNPIDRVGNEVAYAKNMAERNPLLSASLISHKFTGTYMNRGWAYILQVPKENIIGTKPSDTGLLSFGSQRKNVSQKVLDDWKIYLGLQTPQQLINDSIITAQNRNNPRHYNEVLIKGVHRENDVESKVKVIGIVVFDQRVGEYGNKTDFRFLQQVSQSLGVPLITVPEIKNNVN